MQQGPHWAPPPAPKKRGGGCLTVVLVAAFGFAALIAVGVVAIGLTETKQSPAEQKRLDDENAARVAQNAAAEDAFRAAVRKGCKLQPDAGVHVPSDAEQRDRCRDLLAEKLKVPNSENFPLDPYPKIVSEDGCGRIYASSYTAKNAFGVEVRGSFKCTLNPKDGSFSLKTE